MFLNKLTATPTRFAQKKKRETNKKKLHFIKRFHKKPVALGAALPPGEPSE
jgi:late competence protein required for DNA uptake (superfamily II DNA/RNA helicase)